MGASKSLVYFGYLGDEATADEIVGPRLDFMADQLRWLSALIDQLAEPVERLVAYVAPRSWDDRVHAAIAHHRFAVDPASIRSERRNSFEYAGFRAMKAQAAERPPDDLIYYCHSKGITQLSSSKMGLFRLHSEVGLTADLAALTGDADLTRAGLFPSKWGWCWNNFFWVKAGYMARLAVEESPDRYHYESLIGDPGDKEGYRRVLPLIDRLPFDATGIAAQPWYRPQELNSSILLETCYRYAAMAAPDPAARAARD